MIETVSESWHCFKEGAPGRRFHAVYAQGRRARQDGSAARRAVPIAVGVFLILAGIAIGWLPGPGGFIGIFGVALLATQFRWLARVLDWMELRLRAAWRVVWTRRSAPARVAVTLAAVAVATGAAWVLGRMLL